MYFSLLNCYTITEWMCIENLTNLELPLEEVWFLQQDVVIAAVDDPAGDLAGRLHGVRVLVLAHLTVRHLDVVRGPMGKVLTCVELPDL